MLGQNLTVITKPFRNRLNKKWNASLSLNQSPPRHRLGELLRRCTSLRSPVHKDHKLARSFQLAQSMQGLYKILIPEGVYQRPPLEEKKCRFLPPISDPCNCEVGQLWKHWEPPRGAPNLLIKNTSDTSVDYLGRVTEIHSGKTFMENQISELAKARERARHSHVGEAGRSPGVLSQLRNPSASQSWGYGDPRESRGSAAPLPQPRLRTGRGDREAHGEALAGYPKGGRLPLAAPRSSRGEGGPGPGSGARAAAAAAAAAKEPEPPERAEFHAGTEAADHPRGLPLGRSDPPPAGACGGRKQRSAVCGPTACHSKSLLLWAWGSTYLQAVEILAAVLGEETPGTWPRAFRFHRSLREKFSLYRNMNIQTIAWPALSELSPYLSSFYLKWEDSGSSWI